MDASPQQLQKLARQLGLTEETLQLVRVLPLVHVAWSDGAIQDEERDIIKAHAATLGIHSLAAQDTLSTWLDDQPPADFFARGLQLLSWLLATLPIDDARAASADITDFCEAVAQAAGGLMGYASPVAPEERLAMREVSARLNLGTRVATRKLLRDVLELAESH